MNLRTVVAASALASSLLMAAPGHATQFCEVVKTRDGFAALRASPGADGKNCWRG